MSIGGALAAARSQAGMTISEVSQRTRIRETIIRDIEQDNYATCGGDYYARGHIRAIARAVGTDPVPLIAEYDAARMALPETTPAPASLIPAAGLGNVFRMRADTGPADTGPADHPPADADHPPADADQLDVPAPRASEPRSPQVIRTGVSTPARSGITAAEAFRPAMPLVIDRRRPRRIRWTGFLALLLLAAIAILGYALASGSPRHTTAGSAAKTSHTHNRASAPAHKSKPSASPSATATATPVVLTPVSAAAFGPNGAGQGDNASEAPLAIDGNDSTDWQTDWYGSANFAGLQSGTGLLLDMGRQVTVTSAQLLLGPAAGAQVQLRVGNTASLADLTPVANGTSTNSGTGTLTLQPAQPAQGQYILVWFTSLPPDGAGTYQADLYNITIEGTS